jgi:hypothetical protein
MAQQTIFLNPMMQLLELMMQIMTCNNVITILDADKIYNKAE